MPISQLLEPVHEYEEVLRAHSLADIGANEALSDHLLAVNDALHHLGMLVHVETEPGSDLHTAQLFAIRLFNVGTGALKLGLSGYYQQAYQLLRDSLEMVNLIDLFRADRTKISQWRTADDKTLKTTFGVQGVRHALAALPDYAGQDRKTLYSLISSHAAHMTYKSFQLIAPGSTPTLGAFFDAQLLKALLEDTGRHLAHATLGLSTLFVSGLSLELLAAKAAYIDGLRTYYEKHMQLRL